MYLRPFYSGAVFWTVGFGSVLELEEEEEMKTSMQRSVFNLKIRWYLLTSRIPRGPSPQFQVKSVGYKVEPGKAQA